MLKSDLHLSAFNGRKPHHHSKVAAVQHVLSLTTGQGLLIMITNTSFTKPA